MDWTIYLGLLLSAFLAGSILPFSSEAALAAAVVAYPGKWAGFIAAASAGNIAGSALNWWLGTRIELYRDRPWFPASPSQLQRAQDWFGRYGIYSLLLAWVPVIGDPLTVAAGLMRVSLWATLLLAGVGKIARYLVVAAALI